MAICRLLGDILATRREAYPCRVIVVDPGYRMRCRTSASVRRCSTGIAVLVVVISSGLGGDVFATANGLRQIMRRSPWIML